VEVGFVMPKIRLNDKTVRGLKARPGAAFTEYVDTLSPGFGVRVYPSGRKSFWVRYRVNGAKRRKQLGLYPEVAVATARQRAQELPREQRQARGRDASSVTLAELAEEYLTKHAELKKKPRSVQEDRRILHKEILPAWGHLCLEEIDVERSADLFDAIAARGAPIMANRTRALASKMWSFAMARGWVRWNPIKATEKPGVERRRDRVLSWTEIASLWQVWEAERSLASAAFQVLLLTGQRKQEVIAMTWSELDDEGWWTMPVMRVKTNNPHRVPIVAQMRRILARLEPLRGDGDFVFASRDRQGRPSHITELKTANRRYIRLTGIEGWSPHTLRHTAVTRMAELKIPRHIRELIFNHAPGGTNARYDHWEYADEVKAAMKRWADHLESVVAS